MPRTIQVKIKNEDIPVKIYFENRQSSRIAIGKDIVHLRLPATIEKTELEERLSWMSNWLQQLFTKKPDLLNRFRTQIYQDGDVVIVGSRSYTLNLKLSDKQSSSGKLSGHTIQLNLSQKLAGKDLEKSIKTLLSRIIGNDFLPEITERVLSLNDIHFRQKIKSVKLRYTHSRWGSCSTSGAINLSTRLLFAPDHVIDYVIIHELAHLLQANHSDKFWQLVSRAMPDYREKELWLKTHGSKCDF